MSDEYVAGVDAKMYRNTGTFGTPVWVLVTCVQDVTVNGEGVEAPANKRGTVYGRVAVTLLNLSEEFTLLYIPGDAGYEAIRSAFFARSMIDLAFSSGLIATSGSEYVRHESNITKCTRNEPLEGVLTWGCTSKVRPTSNDPSFTKVA